MSNNIFLQLFKFNRLCSGLIIRLEDKTAAQPIKFEELKKDIVAHLKNEQTSRKIADMIKQAKTNGFAKISKF